MAKQTKGAHVGKITFGKRRVGKHKKSTSPKDKSVKPYKGQGK
jgi:hypothetical protein